MLDNDNLEGVKVGDYIYSYVKYGAGLSRAKVAKETDKTFITDKDSKVRKSDGLVLGSNSGGRYGHFDTVYYFKSTPEIELQYKIQRVKAAVIGLGQISSDKLIVTSENMDSIISAINTIRAAVEKDSTK
jgi:hypothetical protein